MKRGTAGAFKYAGAMVLLAGIRALDALSRKSGMAEERRRENTQMIVPIMYAMSRRADRAPVRCDTLRVMTLNVAHGRKNGRHQLLRRTSTIRTNLDDVATVFQQQRPDVVALQEADGPSAWSGSFDHVRYVSERAGLAYSIRGEHVKRKNTSYGTAILSDLPIDTSVSVTFSPSPPTFSKGYVMSTIDVPGYRAVDVVSVHLDFSRKAVRERQAVEIAQQLRMRTQPLIIMGDFNCDWASKEKTLRLLMDTLNLTAYLPGAKNMITYPKSHRRLDWILVSSEFEFITYNVIGDTISDHQGVIAELRFN
jgi:endonuclease/exonuclease/phosphatase family metal-dependent hydrolase